MPVAIIIRLPGSERLLAFGEGFSSLRQPVVFIPDTQQPFGSSKHAGITVFTIGFDITTTQAAYTEMRDCATVPGNFFDVDGLDLFAAFQQINSFIKKLQLTL